ncbi:hypothetical protein [Microbacterium sp. zg-YB36]|uniref:hypothetical protein n=1 Tax=Microbacterium sp. zg-YB36 TaxID=2969407 RepID=UPI00214CC149|nr:hypothetical protein [Microbacterium sp. zg-YB36]MDL5352990.1 hypothetical protein [Microbacterium sp. zg-YB36]
MTAAPRSAVSDHTAAVGRRITRDSLWLSSGYAVTSLSGFVFWMLAAVWIPQTQLGLEASALSIIMAAAALASNGPGSALVVMLPMGGPAAWSVLRRAYAVTAALGAAAGLAAGGLVAVVLRPGLPGVVTVVGVMVCTVAWALFNVQTQALAGAADARGTLIVNGSANLVKLALLALLALAVPGMPHPLVTATIVPAAMAIAVGAFALVPRALRREQALRPSTRTWDAPTARAFGLFTVQNAVAVGVVMCAGLSLSFIVTALSSPAEGAVFAIAYQFSVALDLVGVSVATALAKSAAADFDPSAGLAGAYTRTVFLVVGALGVAATVATPVLFLIAGQDYSPLYGMAVVGALALASLIRPGYDIWSALSRARHRVRPVLWSNLLYVSILFGVVLLLVPTLGALGAALAMVCGVCALAAVGAVGLRRVRDLPARAFDSKGVAA